MNEGKDDIYRLMEGVHDAKLAEQITDNKIYQETWKVLERAIFDSFMATPSDDKEQLQAIRIQYSLLQQLNQCFNSLITTGKLNTDELNFLQDKE